MLECCGQAPRCLPYLLATQRLTYIWTVSVLSVGLVSYLLRLLVNAVVLSTP
ncbi:DUF2474 domain-containing protein [Pseudomonas sp. PDM11]|uniref:DUF2474 domain-containing protein n=1 Tax=Pseudomonas sp. PDM11 TaxID=2769309 RepID=UPI00298C3DE1|nr:DUF2474 domain-containing protein [Pseudomonas sp. PDM11]